MKSEFNPFEIRRCRDIRNRLGSAMIDSIRRGHLEPARRAASAVEPKDERDDEFVENRLSRYETVLEEIRIQGIAPGDVYPIADLLWHQGLFFECHEWLEQNWQVVHGLEKQVLQALIRSAGACELFAYGRINGAVRTASKALTVLIRNRENIPPGVDIQPQIDRLKTMVTENPDLAI